MNNGQANSVPEGHITARERQKLIIEIGKRAFNARSFWIFTHENPDGDAIGCCLAAYGALSAGGRKVQVFSPDPIPRMYQFLPHAEDFIHTSTLPDRAPDVVLVCDNASYERLGSFAPELARLGLGPRAAKRNPHSIILNIDHHTGNERFGDVNLVDLSCGACGELFYYILTQLRIPITLDIAINLYAAILTDTGRFSYGNTTQETFRIASELIRIGVDPFDVVNRVYNTKTPDQIRLLALIMHTIREVDELGYFYCCVTQDMLRETNTVLSDTEGAMDLMKTVAGYDACFFLKEELDGNVKVSARSDTHFDVNRFARRFKGGGHPAASGFRMFNTIAEAPAVIEQAMREARNATAGQPESVVRQ